MGELGAGGWGVSGAKHQGEMRVRMFTSWLIGACDLVFTQ